MIALALLVGSAYYAFRLPKVQTLASQWVMKQLSHLYNTKITVGGVDISFFKSVVLEKVMIEDQQQDTLIYIDKAVLHIDSLKLLKKRIHFGLLNFQSPKINILKDKKGYNFQFLLNSSLSKKDSINQWKASFTNLSLEDSKIKFKDLTVRDTVMNGVNFNDLNVDKLNLSLVKVESTDSVINFFIDKFSFHEKSGFNIGNLRFKARIDAQGVQMSNFMLDLDHSHVEAKQIKVSKNIKYDNQISANRNQSILNQYIIDGNFNESLISLADLAYLIPDIWGMNEPVLFSGSIMGSLNKLKLKKVNIKIGKKTQLTTDLELSGLPDWENTFIFFKLYNNVINFNDLATIRLPATAADRYLKIPKTLLNNLNLTYQGNFTGFPHDFVAYGNLRGDLGMLFTDIAIRPKKTGEISFNGNLNARSFQVGRILDYDPLGAVSLKIKVNGTKFNDKKFTMKIDGNIDSLYFNNSRIDSINVNGIASERSYEGTMSVTDNNLQMNFSGLADLTTKIPVFNFRSNVKKADLFALGLDKEYKDSGISFDLVSNFSGNYIDNVNGQINLNNFSFTRDKRTLQVKNLVLNTTNNQENNAINIRSDIADVDITGKYRFRELDLTIRDYINYFLPSARLPFSQRATTGKNSLNYYIRIKRAEELGGFISSGLEIKSPVVLTGSINSEKKTLTMDASANEIHYNKTIIKGLALSSRNVGNQWLVRAGTEEVLFGGSIKAQNLAMNNSISHDSLKTAFTWNNSGTSTYSGKIDFMCVFTKNKQEKNLADFYINQTNIWVADSLWQIDKSKFHVDSTSISINNFNIHHNNEGLLIDGKISENQSDKLNILFKKVRLGNLDLLLGKDLGIDGTLNGIVSISNPYHSFYFTSDLRLSDFIYVNKNFGDILIKNDWNEENKRLNSSIKLEKNGISNLAINGYYEPDINNINVKSSFTDFPVETIFPFLSTFANKLDGTGNGTVNITGKLSNPVFKGKVAVTNASIGIDYTKVVYYLNDTVRFSGDSIIFKNITVRDSEKNQGLFNGILTHKLFSKMTYNLSATTSKILALNTKAYDNNLFYGVAHCSGKILLTGQDDKLKMTASLKSEAVTQINVPLENPESVKEYHLIRFVNPDTLVQKSQQQKITKETNNFELDLDLTATPDAKIQMLFNSSIGDAINGQGNGNLRFIYDKEGDFYIYGNYVIEKGDYMFVLQNVINRKFKIEQGGTVSFNGDIYNALVDINAVYTLKTSVADLLPSISSAESSRRIPVECKINLSKKLFNPAVKFDISFPTADERTKDELQQYLSTQDDINRQMLSLMVMGQFFTPEYLRGRQDFQSNPGNIVGSTTSDILSNALSNWLSQISNDFDIGFKYRPGDQLNSNQMEVALSTQIFNNRVTINGNIGNNSNLQSNTANPVVGEVEVYVKLNKSGKLQLKAYNRANDDLIYDTSLYKQGLGLTFKEEFDSLSDLFNFYKSNKAKSSRTAN
jgi:hypothetical protein